MQQVTSSRLWRGGPFLFALTLLFATQILYGDEAATIKWIESSGGTIMRDDKQPGKPVVGVRLKLLRFADFCNSSKMPDAGLKDLPALRLEYNKATETSLKRLAALKNLQTLEIDTAELTDGVLATLRELGMLHTLANAQAAEGKRPTKAEDVVQLDLRFTGVTDAGLKTLADFKNLQTLSLTGTTVTDAGLKDLVGLDKLESLNIGDNLKVTDAGLDDLANHKNLRVLYTYRTMVTAAGARRLQDSLKECKVLR